MTRRAAFACFCAVSLSCGGDRAPPPGPGLETAALGGDIVARVGRETISVGLLERVAAEQHVEPREALRRLLDDAIAADAARRRMLDQSPPGRWNLDAARGRLVAEKLLADARAAGPPTDDEIRDLSAEFWREVDRPPALRVVHAVVLRGKDAKAPIGPDVRAVATAILAAAKTATDPQDFQAKAKAVPHPKDVQVAVEALGGFVADGRTIEGDPNGRFDVRFAEGAFAIPEGETTSGIVESGFGLHVIRIVERLPEQRMPLETRRVAFAASAHATRAKRALDAVLAAQRGTLRVTVLPSAEQTMREATPRETRP